MVTSAPKLDEATLKQRIQASPKDTANYFMLAKLYEDAGDMARALATLEAAVKAAPKDVAVYLQLAGFHNRHGDFAKTMDALTRRTGIEPGNPEAYHTMAAYYWEKAYRDTALSDAEKRDYIGLGLQAADQAIALNPDYMEALTYKNLLLRSQALLESDPAAQKRLMAEADELRNRAIDIRKARQAAGSPTDSYPTPKMEGAGAYAGAPPPPPPPPPAPKKVTAAAPVPPDAPPPPPEPPWMAGAATAVAAGNMATSGSPVYEKGEPGLTMPVVISETRPQYTREAMQAKIAGTVGLSCIVETDGTVREVTVVSSLDPALDGQAVAAARKWQFRPGTKDGRPVRVRVALELTFTLR